MIDTQQIETCEELVMALIESDKSEYDQILRSMDLSLEHLYSLATWSDKSYTRNCIAKNDRFELILLCWEPNQGTPIHDHGGEECWVYSVDGHFRESIFTENEAKELTIDSIKKLAPGEISYMIDYMGYHNLKNTKSKRCLSLHLYAKPIRSCNIYSPNTQTTKSQIMKYDVICENIK